MRKTFLLCLSALLTFSGAHAQLFVSTYGAKNVLLEVGTGIWEGFCPDLFQDIEEKILPFYPNAIIAAWHGSDSLALTGDPFSVYLSGYPSGTVDRADFAGSSTLSMPFESYIAIQSTVSPRFDVDIAWSYDSSTRIMDIVVTGTPLMSLTGTWYMNALIIQDSISSAGAYGQHNYYTSSSLSCTGSPSWFATAGSIISPSTLFYHSEVVKKILAVGGSINGEPAFVNPSFGTAVAKHYTYTIPSGANPAHFSVIGMVLQHGTTGYAIENCATTKRLSVPAGISHISDSFVVHTMNPCGGGAFYIITNTYHPGLSVTSDYGDGTTDTHTILSAGYNGFTNNMHPYSTSGTYTIKHRLFNGSTPIDSVSYTLNISLCNVIPVMFYFDINGNCIKDPLEPFINQPTLTMVDSNGVSVDSIPATGGFYYTAYGNPGTVYTFSPISTTSGLSVTCPATGHISDTLRSGTLTLAPNNFGENCTTSGPSYDLQVFSSALAGPHAFFARIAVDNINCTPVVGTVSMTMNPRYDFSSSSPSPLSVSGGVVTWDVGMLSFASTSHAMITIECNRVGASYPDGDTVLTSYAIAPATGDANPSDNVSIIIDTVRAGFDPNYIEVKPSGYIPADTLLTYTIVFENTGHDTAFNIHVMDTLSGNVDISSLRLVMSTANMMFSKLKDASGHNIVKFDFPNINLPDSSHHGLCDAMLVFNIRTRPGLTGGATIFNRCGIYFDGNPVVMTNTVEDIIDGPSKVNTAQQTTLQVYPNPANDELNIKMGKDAYSSFTITNIMGQSMLQQRLITTLTKTDISTLPAGIYFITLKGENGTKVLKFLKQ